MKSKRLRRIGVLALSIAVFFSTSVSFVLAEEPVPILNNETIEESQLENNENNNQLEEETVPSETPDSKTTKDLEKTIENKVEEAKEAKAEIAPRALIPGADITVDTVADLKDSIQLAEQDKTITLSSSFDPNTIQGVVINKANAYNVTVDFGNKTITPAGGKQLTISQNAGGQLLLKNIHIAGTGASGGIVINGASSNVTIADSTITNCVEAIFLNSSGAVFLDNLNIIGNTGAFGAINVNGADVTITNSTFKDNFNHSSGYDGGALCTKNFNGKLLISNCKFINNTATGTGAVAGGRGGAIAIVYPGAASDIMVKDSYFEGNTASPNNDSAHADGGAISVFDLAAGGKFTADGCTFTKNIAGDDGGAMLLQGKGGAKNFLVNNCTFFENEARGKEVPGNSGYTGGAIQAYSSAVSADAVKSTQWEFNNNTFYNNIAKANYVNQNQRGGAITSSGSTWGIIGGMRGVFKNNLFIDNHVESSPGVEDVNSAYANVYFTTVTNNGGNIGLDRGTRATETVPQIFGNYPVGLTANYSNIHAGSASDDIIIPTLPILPNNGTVGLADGTSTASTGIDQRSYQRSKDTGAVEASWIDYDANGGNFNLTELTNYTGNTYYVGETPTAYYDISYINASTTVKKGVDTLDIERTGYEFLGWSTSSTATAADPIYAENATVAFTANDLTLYAVWREVTYATITYDGNTNTAGSAPVDGSSPYETDATVTVLGKGDLAKTDHNFLGWSTDPNATVGDTQYAPGTTFTITDNVTLYAVWQEIAYAKITYNGNTNTIGTAPIDPDSYIADDSITILGKGDLGKTNHTFLGWSTDANATTPEAQYAPGATCTITGNLTLYAVWKENTPISSNVTITYNGNKHTAGNAPVDAQNPYETNDFVTVLDKGNLEKIDYKFLGWSTDPNATVADAQYGPGSGFNITESMTLYAVWEKISDSGKLVPPTDNKPGTLEGQTPLPQTGNGIWMIGSIFLGLAGLGILLATKHKRKQK